MGLSLQSTSWIRCGVGPPWPWVLPSALSQLRMKLPLLIARVRYFCTLGPVESVSDWAGDKSLVTMAFPEPSAIQAPAFHQGFNGLQAVVRWAWLASGMSSSPPSVAAESQASPGWRRGQHWLGRSFRVPFLHLHCTWKQFPRPAELCWLISTPLGHVLERKRETLL